MFYNAKVFSYVGGQQIRIYKNTIKKGEEKKEENKKILDIEDCIEQIELDLQKQEVKESNNYLKNLEETEKKKNISIKNSVNRSINKIYSLARSSEWDYFVTMTFDPQKVDRFNYEDCLTKMSNWLKNYGRNSPDFKYLVVPEQHKSGAWHFHGLFSDGDYSSFVDSGKYSNKDKIFNIGSFRYGFTTATKVKDSVKVSSYICKYITKDCYKNIPVGKKRYWVSRNVKVQSTEILIAPETKESFLKSPELSHISKIKNEYNEITYLEFNYDQNRATLQIKEKNAYDYAISLFGKDIVFKK